MSRKNAIPSHCLHKKTRQGYVRLNGRFFYTGEFGKPQAEQAYNRLIADWFAAGKPKDFAPADRNDTNRFTVVELIAKYWQHAKQHYIKDGRPTDEQASVRVAMRVLKSVAGRKAADDVGPLDIRAIQQHCIGKGNSRRYINQTVFHIRHAFKWAASWELVSPATYEALKTVPGLSEGRTQARETTPVLPVDDNDVDATLPHLREEVQAMVKLQRLTGMRPMEVCNIRPADIDTSGDVWLYKVQSNKMSHKGRERIVAIGPKGQMILRCRMDRQWCFVSSRGQTYTTRTYRDAINRAARKADVPKWNPNQLRHSAATEVRREFGLETTRTVLGHSTTTTSEIYAEKDVQQAMEVARRIG